MVDATTVTPTGTAAQGGAGSPLLNVVSSPDLEPAKTTGLLGGILGSEPLKIEHAIAKESTDQMLMNALIIIAVIAGLKLAQMVIAKAMK